MDLGLDGLQWRGIEAGKGLFHLGIGYALAGKVVIRRARRVLGLRHSGVSRSTCSWIGREVGKAMFRLVQRVEGIDWCHWGWSCLSADGRYRVQAA